MERVAIIGPGAIGSLFAARLARAGVAVSLLDHRAARAAQLRASGIAVRGVDGDYRVELPVVIYAREVGAVDLVLVSVKAYNTEAALRQHLALVGPDTVVWSVQNGLGNVEAMGRVVAPEQVLGGSSTIGANLMGPGRVHHAGEGEVILGELDGSHSPRAERLARLLGRAGFEALVSDDIQRVIWNKLLVNVGINALTALLWVRNGVLAEHESARALMRAAVAEAVAAAAGQGLEFDRDSVQARVEQVARRTANNRSSMLADMQNERRTEIDFLNGAIARLTDAPVNRTLTQLVHALEATTAQRQPIDG